MILYVPLRKDCYKIGIKTYSLKSVDFYLNTLGVPLPNPLGSNIIMFIRNSPTLINSECIFPSMKDLWIVKWFSSSFSLWNFMQLFPGEQKCYKVCNDINNWIGNVLQTQEKWQSWQEPPLNLEINFKRFGDNYSTAQVCFVFCCSFICHLLLQIVNVYFRHWKFSLNLHTFSK